MIKILVIAPKGKMGKMIVKVAAESSDIKIVGGLGPEGRDYIGRDIGLASGLGYEVGALVYSDIEEIIDSCDVVVDFSTVELSIKVLEACIGHKKAFICGTTGFSPEQETKIKSAGKTIPVLKAANTSYLVNLMKRLLGIAASSLGEKAKIEIIDYHDQKKLDAPSGTAKELGAEMAAAASKDPEEIAYHSVRAGDISSTHTVIFGLMGERMEISHISYNWECFARGAIDAVRYLKGRSPGLYTMEDVIS